MDWVTHAVTVFMGFFAVMNPVANTAVFTGLAGNQSRARQIRTATVALLVAFVVVAIFAALGKAVFHLFGITLPALKIAGGVLVFMIGYTMVHGKQSSMHHPKRNESIDTPEPPEEEAPDVAISPLALPILAGPGTLATAMNFSASGGIREIAVTISAFAVLCVVTWVCFVLGQRLVHLIGDAGVAIVTRVMGLIMTVIGVQMLIDGARAAINATS
ncbi:MAG: MarC family protein [Planctomycetota bacterium]